MQAAFGIASLTDTITGFVKMTSRFAGYPCNCFCPASNNPAVVFLGIPLCPFAYHGKTFPDAVWLRRQKNMF